MPTHNDTNGMGAQMLAETYGVGPFHAGGGGGGGGCSATGGGCSATTQVSDPGSYTVPWPQSAALLTPGEISITNASGASAVARTIAKRRMMPITAGPPRRSFPDPDQAFYDRLQTDFTRFDDPVETTVQAWRRRRCVREKCGLNRPNLTGTDQRVTPICSTLMPFSWNIGRCGAGLDPPVSPILMSDSTITRRYSS